MTETTTPRPADQTEWAMRFAGVDRLYGKGTWRRLANGRVAVVGLGGVGSWTVEALARTGVGHLTLIDLDDVCVTNTNRQLPALDRQIGMPKAEVLAERVRSINPGIEAEPVLEFLIGSNAERLLEGPFDCVIDAVDRMSIKAIILDTARQLGWPAITVGASGGKRYPHRIQVADLGASGGDELLKQVRKKLRRSHGWPGGEGHHYGIPTVFSTEPRLFPQSDGSVCAQRETEASLRLDCASGLGAVCHVTASFGMMLAGVAIETMLARPADG